MAQKPWIIHGSVEGTNLRIYRSPPKISYLHNPTRINKMSVTFTFTIGILSHHVGTSYDSQGNHILILVFTIFDLIFLNIPEPNIPNFIAEKDNALPESSFS